MHLVVHHMMELNDIDDTYRGFLVEPFTCFTIIQIGMAKLRQSCFSDPFRNFIYTCTIEDWSGKFQSQLFPGPAQYGFVYLSQVHTARYAQWIQHDINRSSVFKERHIFLANYLGNDTFATMTTRHL